MISGIVVLLFNVLDSTVILTINLCKFAVNRSFDLDLPYFLLIHAREKVESADDGSHHRDVLLQPLCTTEVLSGTVPGGKLNTPLWVLDNEGM